MLFKFQLISSLQRHFRINNICPRCNLAFRRKWDIYRLARFRSHHGCSCYNCEWHPEVQVHERCLRQGGFIKLQGSRAYDRLLRSLRQVIMFAAEMNTKLKFSLGGRHRTEVMFALLTQLAQVRFLVFPRFFWNFLMLLKFNDNALLREWTVQSFI